MRPSDYPIQYQKLLIRWEAFTNSGKIDYAADSDGFDPVILDSWQRCYSSHHSPHTPKGTRVRSGQINSLLQRHKSWTTIAVPHVEEILQCLDGADHAILVTDKLGSALYLAGQNEITSTIEEFQLGVGAHWSESAIGTNAVGLSLHTAMPIQVVGPEHYYNAYHSWATTAAPIHDNEGRIIGSVGLISPAEKATRRDIALTMSAASAINGLIQAEQYLEQANQQLRQMNSILEGLSEGVLMWDVYSRIVYCNTTASDILGLSVSNLRGKDVDQLVKWPVEVNDALSRHADIEQMDAQFYAQGKQVCCRLSIRSLNRGGQRGETTGNYYVALLSSSSTKSAEEKYANGAEGLAAGTSMEAAEKGAILHAGIKHHGVVTKMANELSISRTTLWRKMRSFNINPAQFKKAAPSSDRPTGAS